MNEAATTTRPPEPPQRVSLGWRVAGAFVRRREASIGLVLLGLVLIFSFRTDAFFGQENARVIAEFSAPIAIIAAGEVMLLICGEIDLSAGNVYAFSAWIFYFAVTDWSFPIWLAVIAGLLSGSIVGLVNGLITVVVGVPSFITTLGMIFLLNGLTLKISGAFPVETPGGHTFFRFFGGSPYSTLYWALGVIVFMAILLGRTRWGLRTIATGGNLVGASESGVNVRAIKIGNFILCSTLGALAGILEGVRLDIDPAASGRHVDHVLRRRGGGDRWHLAVRRLGHDHRRSARCAGPRRVESRVHAAGDQRVHVRSRARDRDHRVDVLQRHPRADSAVGPTGTSDVGAAGHCPNMADRPDAIRVENIRKRFGVVTALEDVSLHLAHGEVLGLIGDNGAGKSTLIKILTGFHKPDDGRIFVNGEEVQLKSVTHARSLGIDTVFQDLALVPGLSVYHNMFLNRGSHTVSGQCGFSTTARCASARGDTWTTSACASRRWTPRSRACRRSSARRSPSRARRTRTRRSCCSTSRSPPWARGRAP